MQVNYKVRCLMKVPRQWDSMMSRAFQAYTFLSKIYGLNILIKYGILYNTLKVFLHNSTTINHLELTLFANSEPNHFKIKFKNSMKKES